MKKNSRSADKNLPASLRTAFFAIVLGTVFWAFGMIVIYAFLID